MPLTDNPNAFDELCIRFALNLLTLNLLTLNLLTLKLVTLKASDLTDGFIYSALSTNLHLLTVWENRKR